jgi:formylglycine-generating enzyme required for sulfatase activity/class 3 adenylate cyclase
MSGESTRKLAAIMVADIAGYSRMMGADERGTHVRVLRLFSELVEPTIVEHRGRLIKTRGDGFLAMFDSPVEAVRCAIVIQQSMISRNLDLPSAQWIRFRMGVNLGDVIVEQDDIYGEGVNVAARLEQLAEPGNIYISGGVYEQVRYKLVCGYQSLGDRKVKNIVDPVPIYRVLPDTAALARAARGGRVRLQLLSVGMIIVLGIGGAWYALYRRTEQPVQSVAATPQASTPPETPRTAASAVVAPEQHAPAPPVRTMTGVDPAVSPPDRTPGPASANSATPPAAPAPASPTQMQAAAVPARPQVGQLNTQPVIAVPEMVPIAGGIFRMGSNEDPSEQPVHSVTIQPFLIAKYPVTLGQWRACVAAKVCTYMPSGDDDAPISNVSWFDAQQFIGWLSESTKRGFRLPSESEWEYAARGGTASRYWWGNVMKPGLADCNGCDGPHGAVQPTKVGILPANPFGLHDIGGGVAEWVEDCWHKDYRGSPADGSAWLGPNCRERVLRGGSWRNDPSYVRSASRDSYDAVVRYPTHGFRLAQSP